MTVATGQPLWAQMTARQRLASKCDYMSYNYGEHHPLTVAARAGDIVSFRAQASHITELMDTTIVWIVDAAD